MRQSLFALLLLVPAVAMADGRCEFHADRHLDLDFSGVRQVRFLTGSYELEVAGNASGNRGSADGKACASDKDALENLVITQSRDGDVLTVTLGNFAPQWHWNSGYNDLRVTASVPAGVPVRVEVASGTAKVRSVASLDTTVASGLLKAEGVKGQVGARVASGQATFTDIGSLNVESVASGSLDARQIRGNASLGSVASGSLRVSGVNGNVSARGVASGGLTVSDVKGSLAVDHKGSGSINYSGIGGTVDVPKDR